VRSTKAALEESMNVKICLVLAGLALAACGGGPATSSNTQGISCTTTPDCAARGGTCIANQCHADNECASDADCTGGDTCVTDPDFGGLCTAPGEPPHPLPAWSCSTGKDCPANEGCASDGLCHVDGECHNTWQGELLVGDCSGGLLCAAGGDDPLAGFCTDDRGGPNPYCRSTGAGECRYQCATNDDCGTGDSCVAGFCHGADECDQTSDCSPNHVCGLPANWEDDGYHLCLDDENPTCVNDGQGACRLACATDVDCLDGGGCGADSLCHASNECQTTANCGPNEACYPNAEFGGLCGPATPH
jgi:hypothetical protein